MKNCFYELPRDLMLLREERTFGFGEHTGNALSSMNSSCITTSVSHESDTSLPELSSPEPSLSFTEFLCQS